MGVGRVNMRRTRRPRDAKATAARLADVLRSALGAVLLITTSCAAAPPAQIRGGARLELLGEAIPSSIDELFTLFGVDKVSADFVVVVDTSGSMSQGPTPPYPAVLKAFLSLVESIPDGDNLSVLTFDGSPNLSFQGKISDKSRNKAKDALPATATGEGTDIGSALDATLRRLERADSADVQTVIFLTDGQHVPAPGSAFPTTSGPEWDQLRVRADQARRGHDTQVLGIGLGEQGAGGIELLRQVFGNPEINSLPPDQLADFFRESVRRSQLARLATLVDKELANPVTVESKGSMPLEPTMDVDVVVHSNLKKLPVDLSVSGVTATNADGDQIDAELIGAKKSQIGPGGSETVNVRIEPPVKNPGFKVPPVTEQAKFTIQLNATYQVLPKDLLARVSGTATSGEVQGQHSVDAIRTYGRSVREILTLLAMVLLTLLVLAWLYRRFLQLPKLVGVFVVDSAAAPEKSVIQLKGKHHRITAKDVPGAGGAKIELFTRRGKPKRVFARVDTPPFFEVEDRRRERVVPEETEIRVNRYRLGGGRMKYWPKEPERTSDSNDHPR
ncbi:exported hypothetical protein [Candidatus Microthrix parvicella RN1]|uniref:VWFA domain-containing protein n=1 Tax=Candidatus Neomicrothrix parvicella RN1 TaxID=1229780 RepID=R4Z7G9_9ACTN|nr:exported hypothetical protein [Candidatus Microthrix parvicella RN1]